METTSLMCTRWENFKYFVFRPTALLKLRNLWFLSGFCRDNCCSFCCCGVATDLIERSLGGSAGSLCCICTLQLVGCCSCILCSQRIRMRTKYGIDGRKLKITSHHSMGIGQNTTDLDPTSFFSENSALTTNKVHCLFGSFNLAPMQFNFCLVRHECWTKLRWSCNESPRWRVLYTRRSAA